MGEAAWRGSGSPGGSGGSARSAAEVSPLRPAPGFRFPGTDDAQVVEIETRVWRRVIRRRRYRPSCTCGVLPGLVTAPLPSPFDRTR